MMKIWVVELLCEKNTSNLTHILSVIIANIRFIIHNSTTPAVQYMYWWQKCRVVQVKQYWNGPYSPFVGCSLQYFQESNGYLSPLYRSSCGLRCDNNQLFQRWYFSWLHDSFYHPPCKQSLDRTVVHGRSSFTKIRIKGWVLKITLQHFFIWCQYVQIRLHFYTYKYTLHHFVITMTVNSDHFWPIMFPIKQKCQTTQQ